MSLASVTNGLTPASIVWGLWILFAAYWTLAALRLKRTKRRETVAQRLGYLLPLIAAFFFFSQPITERGWLAAYLLPESASIEWGAAAVVAVGIAICFWARWHLGANWSGTVTLKEGHELIRTGPYRTIRHPIYTGILLAMLGTALQIGQVRAFIAVLFAFSSFYFKARREESFLTQEFGDRFAEHSKHTGMFLPRLS
jgi:protein-S-isoprenylcysteine O-methyltransferase Ste14